jgi:hypothetical protein
MFMANYNDDLGMMSISTEVSLLLYRTGGGKTANTFGDPEYTLYVEFRTYAVYSMSSGGVEVAELVYGGPGDDVVAAIIFNNLYATFDGDFVIALTEGTIPSGQFNDILKRAFKDTNDQFIRWWTEAMVELRRLL